MSHHGHHKKEGRYARARKAERERRRAERKQAKLADKQAAPGPEAR